MELKIKRTNLLSDRSEAVMTHRDDEIEWNVSLFERTSNAASQNSELPDYDIFEQINAFWAYLPISQQDKIFEVYQRVRALFDNVWDPSQLTGKLQTVVRELYQYHDLAEIRHWVDFHSKINWPHNLKESFVPSFDNNGSREKTYLKEDYKWLVVLSIGVRAMFPLWGEFVSSTRKEYGNLYKELYGFRLLYGSSIERSEPMQRLRVFVEQYTPTDKPQTAAIFGGLSSEEFPTWILSLVVLRRLCVADVRGLDQTSTVISFIYKYISQRVKAAETAFVGAVKEKMVEGTTQEGENNLSKLENYKVKEETPTGDVVAIDHYLQQTLQLAHRVCPDLDPAMLAQALQSTAVLTNEPIQDAQTTVMQWVLARAAPARGMVLVPLLTHVQCIGVALACLWHRGHYDVAALVSGIAQPHNGEITLGGVESRAKITKEQLEQFAIYYPYARRPSGKAKPVRAPNVGVTAVEQVTSLFTSADWKLTLPTEWLSKVTTRNNRKYAPPHDIRVKLAALSIAVASRQF